MKLIIQFLVYGLNLRMVHLELISDTNYMITSLLLTAFDVCYSTHSGLGNVYVIVVIYCIHVLLSVQTFHYPVTLCIFAFDKLRFQNKFHIYTRLNVEIINRV